jgi:hypothetical protein
MERLTLFDMSLMRQLALQLGSPVSTVEDAKRHFDLFLKEDLQGGAPGDELTSYVPELDPDVIEYSPPAIYNDGGSRACGSTAILLKHAFQRPRAMQIAVWMNTPPAVSSFGRPRRIPHR